MNSDSYLSKMSVTEEGLTRMLNEPGNPLNARHKLVYSVFPENQERDFLYIEGKNPGDREFIIRSKEKPTPNPFMELIQCKKESVSFDSGSVLKAFLVFNSVVEVEGSRHDIAKNLVYHNPDLKETCSKQEILLKAASKWVKRRTSSVERGFEFLDNLHVKDHYQHEYDNCRRVRFISKMDVSFLLKVTDSGAFKKTLKEGLGRGKAFGCGLLFARETDIG